MFITSCPIYRIGFSHELLWPLYEYSIIFKKNIEDYKRIAHFENLLPWYSVFKSYSETICKEQNSRQKSFSFNKLLIIERL